MQNEQAECSVGAVAPSPEIMRECFDALVEELNAWALSREKVLAKLDLRGARRARKAAGALKMLDYLLGDGSAYDDAVATILTECHVLLTAKGVVEEEAVDSKRAEQSGRRKIEVVSLVEEDENDDSDKTAPGLPRGVLENYLAEVRRAGNG